MKLSYRLREALVGLSFIWIWIVGFLIFTCYPLIRTLIFSFSEVKITAEGIKTTFIGWENYRNALLMDVQFGDMVASYALETIAMVPIIVVFALIVALLLNMKFRGKGIFRTIYFLPVIITSGPVIKQLMDQGATTLPGIQDIIATSRLHETLPGLLADLITFLLSSFITILWFSGVQMLIFLAGLQKLDASMYEAASIDGASRWKAFWKLTLPALNPMIIVNIVYTVIMQSIFSLNPIIILIQSAMYDPKYGMGYSAALAWIYFLVMLALLAILVLATRQRETNR
ncbi:carbohydrate ABC transporter permease [Paenibacillaceae bacterium WGS1546]|uniref:carbohydrate ABC transporter permease n=1 Tax=Cohnella sp. WGS1546 TaxID=3366810 RepID=UPI00372D045B